MPKDYVPGLCTHVFYAFATMNADFTIHPFEWNDENTDWSVGMYAQVIEWKKKQPGLSVLLSFGGWTYSESNMGSLRAMASTAQNRKTFITSVVQLIKKYNFDGFDVDWEYPTADDKDDFSQLLRDLRNAFDASVPRLLLTAAVSPNPDTIKAGYDAKAITDTLDILNLMAYDFHGAWEMTTGHNSPLYDRGGDKFSISDAAAAWVTLGVPKSKIIVGLATYGRGWTLAGSETKVGAAATAASNANTYTKLAGMIAYYEACDLLSKGAQRFFDDAQASPYLVMGNQWYSYDDADSLSMKLNWIKDNGYAGAFVWTLDFDDFNGKCPNGNGQPYPLISKMKEILTNGNNPFKTPPPKTAGTQPARSTTLLSKITTTTQGIKRYCNFTFYVAYLFIQSNKQTQINLQLDSNVKDLGCTRIHLLAIRFTCAIVLETRTNYHAQQGFNLTVRKNNAIGRRISNARNRDHFHDSPLDVGAGFKNKTLITVLKMMLVLATEHYMVGTVNLNLTHSVDFLKI